MISSWPRLIGIVAGTFGAALATQTGAELAMVGSFQDRPQFIFAIAGCVLLVLAYPLYVAREWARRALLVTTYCIIAALAIIIFPSVYQQTRPFYASFYPVLSLIIGISALIAFLTPPAFLLAVLHHADVRHAFQGKNASNKSLEPTSGRSVPLL